MSAETLPLFAVFDPARDGRIWPLLRHHAPEADCLFRGPLDPALLRVSPHVLPIVAGGPLAEAWRTEGWGLAWGILVASAAPYAEVRHHLRTLTWVELPGGEAVLFRFWDPRVLRRWLPRCTAEQRTRMFGPIVCYHAETADGAATVTFHADGQAG